MWLRRFTEDLLEHELEHRAVTRVSLLNAFCDQGVNLFLRKHVPKLWAIGYAWLSSCAGRAPPNTILKKVKSHRPTCSPRPSSNPQRHGN
jgi:hypothetical protein